MCDCQNCQCHTINGPIQIRQLEGRDHFVAPAVLLTEGVHNGTNGPLFYSREVLSYTANLWNGKAVIVYHPKNQNGWSGSPEVFNRQRVGYVFNSRMDGIKLVAEVWIDVARVQAVDPRIYDALVNGQRMEVSTGLGSALIPGSGTFNGKPYIGIVQNILPDHLALLPDIKGACSVEDGCGMNPHGKPPVLMPPVPVLMASAPNLVPVLMPTPKPVPVLMSEKQNVPARPRKRFPRRRRWL